MSYRRAKALEVEVRDFGNQVLDRARVVLRSTEDDACRQTLRYDQARAAYLADVAPGEYELRASSAGLEEQTRSVRVAASGGHERFILGLPGMDHYQRGNVKVPFVRLPWVAVTFDPGKVNEEEIAARKYEWEKAIDELRQCEDSAAEVESDEKEPEIHDRYTILLSVDDSSRDAILPRVIATEGVSRAGPLVSAANGGVSFLTDEMIVRFRGNVGEQAAKVEIETIGQKAVKLLRRVPYVPNGFHVKLEAIPSYELLQVASELTLDQRVEWAEPNLAGTAVPDDATSGDVNLESWDRELVNTRKAWQLLEKAGKEIGGDPDIIVAVVDTGVDSSHPAFRGEVSNGHRKFYEKSYDFRRMQEGNDHLLDGRAHGTKVAGIAAAAGDEGVMGVAPNCRVMGLIYPATELETLDMYYWAAGLDPQREDFPEPLARGADIFVTCVGYGFSVGMPISGSARQMIDALTAQGRGGKGCLFFCSAGNDADWCSAARAWAVHDTAIGVAASSLASDGATEARASYSNYGLIELCAPSSGAGRKTASTTPLAQGAYGEFGGTSSAAPLAAGAAALMLSARPELSWEQVRTILRSTAVSIDPANSDPIGAWLDAGHEPSRKTGNKPVFSFFYGYGRLDAARAVEAAFTFPEGPVVESAKPPRPVSSINRHFQDFGSLLYGLFYFLGAFHGFLALLVLGAVDGNWLARLFAAISVFNLLLGGLLTVWFRNQEDKFHEEDEETPKNPPSGG